MPLRSPELNGNERIERRAAFPEIVGLGTGVICSVAFWIVLVEAVRVLAF